MCKKQTAVSHSSSEAEIIALDAALRLEGIPSLMLWDLVLDVYAPSQEGNNPTGGDSTRSHSSLTTRNNKIGGDSIRSRSGLTTPETTLAQVDAVPPTFSCSTGRGRLVMFEDTFAVTNMIIEGRAPTLRLVPRTHKVDLDWPFRTNEGRPRHLRQIRGYERTDC